MPGSDWDGEDPAFTGELTVEELVALAALDDGPGRPGDDELDDPWEGDPDCGPPAGWLVMSDAERAELAGDHSDEHSCDDDDDAVAGVPEPFGAGFTHRDGGRGCGFAAGGPVDAMEPGPELAWFTDETWAGGLGRLSDDELVGFLGAQQRLASRAEAGKLAAVGELATRRQNADGSPGEHVEEELAAELTLTGPGAAKLAARAGGLARLPHVAGALAAGRIDPDKAAVFTGELMLLGDIAAAAIAACVLPSAQGKTTGQIRVALRHEIEAYDPEAMTRRREKAEKDARVETWTEPAGTAALAGRDLAQAGVIAASKALDADARWLKAHGVAGGHDRLRAEAMIARLTGQSLQSLLPQAPSASPGGEPAGGAAASGALGGTVNLIMPAAAWLGRSGSPGEVAGFGAASAGTCRGLAAALAASAAARWCVTLVDKRGRAVAHGCARRGPGHPPPATGPPATGPPATGSAAWLAGIEINPIETGTCRHRRETAAYRPPDVLRHIIKIRSRRCGFPGCRRAAAACDDDHTIPHHKGGKTCECNLHPLCRRHHQVKQARGWRLDQPQPGVLAWTLPSGRQVTVHPEPYPT